MQAFLCTRFELVAYWPRSFQLCTCTFVRCLVSIFCHSSRLNCAIVATRSCEHCFRMNASHQEMFPINSNNKNKSHLIHLSHWHLGIHTTSGDTPATWSERWYFILLHFTKCFDQFVKIANNKKNAHKSTKLKIKKWKKKNSHFTLQYPSIKMWFASFHFI